ncbi:hypothetical protein PI172_1537 [Prevotella intermedia]|uniref:Uncharacterized protein n=1 Tax=Prevotella intermedia TaxID=28131 RepID=A0AAD1BJ67_PREIN|nr:hypothetical protein [Prevotella intermedia]APW34104.1 hypothetical protein BWX40_04200 [Prevotella intermedia]BAR96265.1 hypothetical protein PI172_1537 [Prevotella intermedia]
MIKTDEQWIQNKTPFHRLHAALLDNTPYTIVALQNRNYTFPFDLKGFTHTKTLVRQIIYT